MHTVYHQGYSKMTLKWILNNVFIFAFGDRYVVGCMQTSKIKLRVSERTSFHIWPFTVIGSEL